jgi:hypothetical protein
MPFSPKFNTKNAALVFALLLGIYAVWMLAAEFARPGLAFESSFPVSVVRQDLNYERLTADIAASIASVRGDLWSERALVDAGNVIGDHDTPAKSLSTEDAEAVRYAAVRALSSRPLDSRIWLVLAALSSERTGDHEKANQQLKMSYYTGPNDKAVIGHRLNFVVNSNALDDEDLREMVRREVRTILLRAPELRPAIVAAYHKARPQDREFIEATVSATDPSFVATLRAKQP